MALAKCARCNGIFDKIRSAVCGRCMEDEEQDYVKIRDILDDNPSMKASEVAEVAGVTLACVLRMVDDGRLVNETLLDPVKCGRCGQPAIGRNQRLCYRCLLKLDQEVMASVNELKDKMKQSSGEMYQRRQIGRAHAYHVRDMMDSKRRVTPPPLRKVR